MANYQGRSIRVRGLVQGVGFRPTVWRLARELSLAGEVRNDGDGVLIRLWGDLPNIEQFLAQLPRQSPPLARIDRVESAPLEEGLPPDQEFRIVASEGGAVRTGVVPDAATCPACRHEVLDRDDRRSRYPFTNCTHCGPRLSILRAIPYDRANTSMQPFRMCEACQTEYEDPSDRRFHAQPNACPECGPRVWLERSDGSEEEWRQNGDRDAVAATARLIREGKIVAVKGIGGFHLACDAGNETAVAELRRRKGRYCKPFALMARDEATIRRYCHLSAMEQGLLESSAAPIVVLETTGADSLAPSVAPGQAGLGFMLPYTPLHLLLMQELDTPIVLTSGNRSEEPQVTANEEARVRLGGIADWFLMHDREIVNRLDDSVVRVMAGEPRPLRRARGYAPAPLPLPPGLEEAEPVTALGGDLKGAFCLLRGGKAIVSQHLGDLEEVATFDQFQAALELYDNLFQHRPQRIAVDLHPGYFSTRFGQGYAERTGIPLVEVQHHHAHIAACLAENGWDVDQGPVLGIALDGLGFGPDGTLWGGEFLRADYSGYERLARFRPFPMIGGDRAAQEPWRNCYAHLTACIGEEKLRNDYGDLPLVCDLESRPLETLRQMVAQGVNSPLSSSAGRWFDAVAAALGICRDQIHYEGQAAIELEASFPQELLRSVEPYPFILGEDAAGGLLDPAPMWTQLLQDLAAGRAQAEIAAAFHRGLADAVVRMALQLCFGQGLECVALSGGVFQNRTLFGRVAAGLEEADLVVLSHREVPTNDGCIALGQAVVTAARALQD